MVRMIVYAFELEFVFAQFPFVPRHRMAFKDSASCGAAASHAMETLVRLRDDGCNPTLSVRAHAPPWAILFSGFAPFVYCYEYE
jgi:hypothetical protein